MKLEFKTVQRKDSTLSSEKLENYYENGWKLKHFTHANSHQDVYTYIFEKKH